MLPATAVKLQASCTYTACCLPCHAGRYVRRQILRRRDEVASGSAGLTSADDSESDAVRVWGRGW